MVIDWKTILSEFDGKPTLLQAIGKLRKAVEEETMTIQQAQAEIAKLESQQKVDEALINTKQDKLNDKSDVTVLYLTATNGINAGTVKTGEVSDDEDNVYNFPKKAGTFALTEDVTAVGTKAQNALDLATTNETDIAAAEADIAEIKNAFYMGSNKQELTNAEYLRLTQNVSTKIRKGTFEQDVFSYFGFIQGVSIYIAVNNINGSTAPNGFKAIKVYKDNSGMWCEFIGNCVFALSGNTLSIVDKKILIQAEADGSGKIYVIQVDGDYKNGFVALNLPVSGGNVVVKEQLKTIFGNQSIVGNGNIDLYYHYVSVTITGVRYPLHIDFYSSVPLECDSLTDLKTLLGATFERALFGSATTGEAGIFFGNFLSNSGAHGIIVGSSTVSPKQYEWADITISDNVSTI